MELVDARALAKLDFVPYSAASLVRLATKGKWPGAVQLVDGGKWWFNVADAKTHIETRRLAKWKSTNVRIEMANPANTGGTDFDLTGRKSTEALRAYVGL